MPEDIKLSQIGSSQLPPPLRGLHSPGVRKHCQIIFACYFRKSSIAMVPHASSAKDCPVWQKEKEIQRVRVEKRISFPEARQLVEAKMPTVISGGKTYTVAATTRRESRSVQCQTSLTWVFSECPLRMSESNVRSSVEGFSHPRRSTPSSRPQVPPKPVASDRLKKAEQNLVLSNQFSALSNDEMDSSSIL